MLGQQGQFYIFGGQIRQLTAHNERGRKRNIGVAVVNCLVAAVVIVYDRLRKIPNFVAAPRRVGVPFPVFVQGHGGLDFYARAVALGRVGFDGVAHVV